MSKNIFDLSNIDDLPPEIAKRRGYSGERKDTLPHKIREIFILKNPLTYHEIKVALYRKYGVNSNQTISQNLSRLRKKGVITREKGSIYSYNFIDDPIEVEISAFKGVQNENKGH